MMNIRKAQERGHANHGWLDSHHSFSFAGYYDPQQMGWGNLRVINEDRIAPDTGFGEHDHRDMEIISYVLEGALAHRDSMGHVQALVPGEVQCMSAGTGVRHSEFNHAPGQTTHFLQIWILPDATGIAPGYEQARVPDDEKRGRLRLVAAPAGQGASVSLHADARVWAGLFDGDEAARLDVDPQRKAYVQVARGQLQVNGVPLAAGDGAMLQGEPRITLDAGDRAEVLVFDLAP